MGIDQTWINNSGNPLSIQGGVDTGPSYTLTVAGSGNVTVGGAITDGGNVSMVGGGTLQLYGANTYTGNTTVNNGTISMTGGTLSSTPSTNEYVGYNNTGSFVQSDGLNGLSDSGSVVWLGYNSASSSGSYTLTGGTVATSRIRMGNMGTGSFTQTGGVVAPRRLEYRL